MFEVISSSRWIILKLESHLFRASNDRQWNNEKIVHHLKCLSIMWKCGVSCLLQAYDLNLRLKASVQVFTSFLVFLFSRMHKCDGYPNCMKYFSSNSSHLTWNKSVSLDIVLRMIWVAGSDTGMHYHSNTPGCHQHRFV